MNRSLLLSLPLAALLACGGNNTPAPIPTAGLDVTATEAASATFLELEGLQVGENDTFGPLPAGEAVGFLEPPAPACVKVDNLSPTSVTWTYTHCAGPHGWTWNGKVTLSWERGTDGTVLVKHTRTGLVGTKDGTSITLNGTRNVLRSPGTRVVQISTDPGFTRAFSDGTTTVTQTYTCALTADWSEAGKRKLHGTWSMTSTAGTAVTGTIAQTAPLVWQPGCCHPVSGTLLITKGSEASTFVFGSPCGTVTVNGTARQLGGCR